MKKIRVPLGDGSSNLQEIDQSYILVASELIDLVDGRRTEPSKGLRSFAKNVLFTKVLADEDSPVQSLSLGFSQELNDLMQLFRRSELSCTASDYRPHKNTPFAAVHLAQQERSVNVWLSPTEPFFAMELNGEAPKFKTFFPSASAIPDVPASKPKLRINVPTTAEGTNTRSFDGEDSAPKRQRRLEQGAAVDPERASYWEQQLQRLGRGSASSNRPVTSAAPKSLSFEDQIGQRYKTPSIPQAIPTQMPNSRADYYNQQIQQRWGGN